jgi:hypothetical protein
MAGIFASLYHNKFINLHPFFRLLGLVLIIILLTRCAQISNPSGGPKDMDPPQVLGTSPQSGRANFEGNKFTIYFDEFVQLDNITQKAMISPPMSKLPDFKLKGKSLQVKFEEELKPNTTYSVYFGDAIVDITEQNALLNYTYIFSTGTTVDSMTILGNVVNSFDLTPSEDVYVLLYKDNNDTLPLDSLPLAVPPYYLSKTDVNGLFRLDGLSNVPYKMFAVKDLNNNYFYDQPGEEIAFLDSIVMPQHLSPPEMDSSVFDTLDFESPYFDSLQQVIDSLYMEEVKGFEDGVKQFTLYLFDEIDTTLQLLKAETVKKYEFRFAFSRPADEVEFKVMNYQSDTTWYLEEYSIDKDTIHWFLRDLPVDTIELLILYEGDTLGQEYMRLDPNRKAYGFERRRKKEDEEKQKYLSIQNTYRGNIIRPDRVPELVFSQPIVESNTDSIMLVIAEDTTYNPDFVFIDSLNRKIRFPLDIEEETKYTISIPDSTFMDWNGLYNDKQSFRLSTRSLREYGVLSMSMQPKVEQPYIIQLMTTKEVVLREHYFYGDTTITMLYLDPGEYVLKVIFDDNGNRKWDSGAYYEKRQPEKVVYYSKNAVIRGNWDLEEDWVIEE